MRTQRRTLEDGVATAAGAARRLRQSRVRRTIHGPNRSARTASIAKMKACVGPSMVVTFLFRCSARVSARVPGRNVSEKYRFVNNCFACALERTWPRTYSLAAAREYFSALLARPVGLGGCAGS